MNGLLREKYLEASKTPNKPVFAMKDVMSILDCRYHSSVQRFDKYGFVKVARNNAGHRLYTYNQIEFIKKLQKLIDFDISLITLKTLMEFETSKGRDQEAFIDEFLEFYTKRVYSRNRSEKRKKEK